MTFAGVQAGSEGHLPSPREVNEHQGRWIVFSYVLFLGLGIFIIYNFLSKKKTFFFFILKNILNINVKLCFEKFFSRYSKFYFFYMETFGRSLRPKASVFGRMLRLRPKVKILPSVAYQWVLVSGAGGPSERSDLTAGGLASSRRRRRIASVQYYCVI